MQQTQSSKAGERTQYRIALTICRDHGPKYEQTAYVTDRTQWDGAWFSRRIEDARIYVSKTWAKKWLTDRPHIDYGRVEVVA